MRYANAPLTQPGEQLEPFAMVRAMHDVIVPFWPGISSGGMRRDSARIGTANHDPHKAGIAIDFMVRPGPDRDASGTSLANFLVTYAEWLQIQYVIWDRVELSTSSYGPRWEPYQGSEPHGDHVHVEIGPDAEGWSYLDAQTRIGQAIADFTSKRAGAVGGGAAAVVGVGAAGAILAGLWALLR